MAKAKDSKPGKSTATAEQQITHVMAISTGTFEACVVGETAIIHNRPSEKAKHELLLPRGPKTATEKATTLKHQPVAEFRSSPYLLSDPQAPTLVAIRGAAFKGAMRAAAIDLPEMKKAQIGRLVRVPQELIEIYGIPYLKMDVVRSADMNRTPDIRTRAAMKEWACRFTVRFVKPLITAQAVVNLLAASGIIDGVGDGRPEKGALDFGTFRICDKNDPDFLRIVQTGGRAAQVEAFGHPVPYDDESAELLTWFDQELDRRQKLGHAGAQTAPVAAAPADGSVM